MATMTKEDFERQLNQIAARCRLQLEAGMPLIGEPERIPNDRDRDLIVYLLAKAVVGGRIQISFGSTGQPRFRIRQHWDIVMINELNKLLTERSYKACATADGVISTKIAEDQWLDHKGRTIRTQAEMGGLFTPSFEPDMRDPYAPMVRKLIDLALEPLQAERAKPGLRRKQRLTQCLNANCECFLLNPISGSGHRKEYCGKKCREPYEPKPGNEVANQR